MKHKYPNNKKNGFKMVLKTLILTCWVLKLPTSNASTTKRKLIQLWKVFGIDYKNIKSRRKQGIYPLTNKMAICFYVTNKATVVP